MYCYYYAICSSNGWLAGGLAVGDQKRRFARVRVRVRVHVRAFTMSFSDPDFNRLLLPSVRAFYAMHV